MSSYSYAKWLKRICRVQIKHITITKCNPFFHYCDAKEISLLFLRYKTLCKTWKTTHEFHLYCSDYVFMINKLSLVDCFHHKFRVSTQIMVHNYFITKCKKFSFFNRLLMDFEPFISQFKIFTLIRTLITCI